MSSNTILVEELRSIILDKVILELYAQNEDFSFLCAKYAKKVWISNENKKYSNLQHCPMNVFYNLIDINKTNLIVNADCFVFFNKAKQIKKNYKQLMMFFNNYLKDKKEIIIVSTSFFDKSSYNKIIKEFEKNSHEYEITRNIKKKKYSYLVVRKKERRGMYGFY